MKTRQPGFALVVSALVTASLLVAPGSVVWASPSAGHSSGAGESVSTDRLERGFEERSTRAVPRVDGFGFSGAVVTPGRYGGAVSLDGDFTVPGGQWCTIEGFGSAGWTSTFPYGRHSCAIALLKLKSDGTYGYGIGQSIDAVGGCPHEPGRSDPVVGLGSLPFADPTQGSATIYFQGASKLTAGTWRWAILDTYCNTRTFVITEIRSLDFLPAVTVPSQVSRAWRTDRSLASVLVGDSVQLSLKNLVTWSDGVVTEEPHSSSLVLQFRETGSGSWVEAGRGSPITVSPRVPGDYRFLVDGVAQPSVFVNVVRPTSANRISGVSVSPLSAVANVPLVFSGTIETQYDDEVWRPAPVGTSFELQFLVEGGSAWSRLVTERVSQAGLVSVRWPMLGSGRFRIVAGTATSESVAVTEVKPTSVVAADPLNLPSEVFPGDPVDISVGVDVQYSDGVYRDAPDGTPFAVEFAESFDPGTAGSYGRSTLTWKTQATGVTKGGKADAQVSPRTSGFWRVAFGDSRTPPVFVEVVGSKPPPPRPVALRLSGSPSDSAVSWVFTPVSGVVYEASASTRSGRVNGSQISLEQSGRVTVSGLPAKTAVTVLVIGSNTFGQTDGGATATATTTASDSSSDAVPGAVSRIQVSAVRGGKVTVSWAAPTAGGAATGYQYRVRAAKWTAWRSVKATRVSIKVTGSARPTVVQIRAVNSSGRGPSQQALL